jgi:uncharacterized protein RhaS with RHS repeats
MDFQNRQYDPQIGRFLSVDPLADDDQEEWSPYAAMGNNPAMMVDPLGLKGEDMQVGLGATALAAAGLISNPVGWAIGIGVLVYGRATLIYDAVNDKKD